MLDSPHKGSGMQSFGVFFMSAWKIDKNSQIWDVMAFMWYSSHSAILRQIVDLETILDSCPYFVVAVVAVATAAAIGGDVCYAFLNKHQMD